MLIGLYLLVELSHLVEEAQFVDARQLLIVEQRVLQAEVAVAALFGAGRVTESGISVHHKAIGLQFGILHVLLAGDGECFGERGDGIGIVALCGLSPCNVGTGGIVIAQLRLLLGQTAKLTGEDTLGIGIAALRHQEIGLIEAIVVKAVVVATRLRQPLIAQPFAAQATHLPHPLGHGDEIGKYQVEGVAVRRTGEPEGLSVIAERQTVLSPVATLLGQRLIEDSEVVVDAGPNVRKPCGDFLQRDETLVGLGIVVEVEEIDVPLAGEGLSHQPQVLLLHVGVVARGSDGVAGQGRVGIVGLFHIVGALGDELTGGKRL